MFGRIIGVLLAVLAIAAVGIGCGSSSDDSSGSGDSGSEPPSIASTSISKAKYVKKGDEICTNVPTEYQKLVSKLPKKQQENKKIATPKAAVPPLRTASEEFAELGAPDGDEAKAEEIVAALEAAGDGLEKEPEGELSGPKSSFAEFNKLTKQMGFKTCSEL
ncbi:MAG TPA: hypothetical protein VFX45_08320 [Solirubrobacterales bacterium]|nr:hypothetical protein [Solirubrobacterales bacterium]